MEICNDLGRDIKYPTMRSNKYLKYMATNELEKLTEEEAYKMKLRFDLEQGRIVQEFNEAFNEYMSSLYRWLIDNGYAKEQS